MSGSLALDRVSGSGPLAGIRVLDLSRVLAGPWCTQCLADLGADVLKVEQPGSGDETRGWGPPEMAGLAAYFTCANRSKRSLAIDLSQPDDRELLSKLAGIADVIVENFKLGTLDRHGLDYESVARINPGIVYCSISGYGKTGPQARRAGYDFVIQGETGLMSVTGEPDGPPMKVGVAVSDLFSGLYASQAILAALYGRTAAGGRGQHIDVALFDCQLAAMANVAANTLATGRPPRRFGNAHPNVVPYEVFEAADGPIVLAVGNDRQFRKLCAMVLGQPDLAEDPRFVTNSARSLNRDALRLALRTAFATRGREELMSALDEQAIPVGIIQTVDEAIHSKQALARSLVTELTNEAGEAVRMLRYPVKFSGPLPQARLPPKIGEGGEQAVAEWIAAKDRPTPMTDPI